LLLIAIACIAGKVLNIRWQDVSTTGGTLWHKYTLTGSLFILVMNSFTAMKTRGILTTAVVLTIFVGLYFGNTNFMVSSASAASSNPLQSSSHVTIQNTTTSSQDPLPGHQGHQLAMVLPPRSDGKLWVGTVTWTSSKPVELAVLHGYNNVPADATHGVPLISKPPSGAVAITLIGAEHPLEEATATFVGSAVAFHLSGAKFTVTYSVDATANAPMKIRH
jgi:hypothetical protein